jgi:uncharacterized membrane protein YjjP (DUF1212 family)
MAKRRLRAERPPRTARRTRMRDITSVRLLVVKAALFVVLAAASAALLLANGNWRSAILLAICTWASARAYYFAFYVIGKYVDPSFRFSGIGSAIVFLWNRR